MQQKETCNFGEHLTIDGYGGNKDRLNDEKLVASSLEDLAKKVDMKLLTKPNVVFAEPNHLKDPGGWSGFVIIAESHISIHTFPGRGFVSIDVYTCKNGMDQKTIIDFFKEAFELRETEINFIKRGTKYPVENID